MWIAIAFVTGLVVGAIVGVGAVFFLLRNALTPPF
jgi:hypothetical protein